ncbi:MAG TPA: NAD-dependent epimerase/dehydratase family protein [Propionibacteriaceae bacterium]|nr:NAD-dependent epimerase/dehydratase family protein [Propionibacteriaceae bacterium]
MKWLLAGASGFLGTAIRVRLASEGHDVVRLVRREPATSTEFRWDPDVGDIDPAAFDGVDVAVNLGGVAVAPLPWTDSRRRQILLSRVSTTSTLAQGLAALADGRRPTLIQMSGIARYGTTSGAEPHTEESAAGADYLAQVTTKWEAATQAAADAGVRVVVLRTSPVMDSSGGTLLPLKLAWSLGLGATLGDGSQRMPMISLRDYLDVVHGLPSPSMRPDPYNLTLPQPRPTPSSATLSLLRCAGRDSSAYRRRSSALRSANWRVSWSAICMWSLSV